MIKKTENDVVLIKQWMTPFVLCLKKDKMEVLVLGSKYYVSLYLLLLLEMNKLYVQKMLEILASIFTQP